jgi:hypothetical protein
MLYNFQKGTSLILLEQNFIGYNFKVAQLLKCIKLSKLLI